MSARFSCSVAFGEKGIAEPMPVGAARVLFEGRFVLEQVGFPVGEGTGVEVHMRPGVIAEEEAGVAPVFEHGREQVRVRVAMPFTNP